MDIIKCATLNVNGLTSDPDKRSNIFQLFIKYKLDIIFVTETHATVTNITTLQKQWVDMAKGKAFFSPAISSRSGGVAILFGPKFDSVSPQNIQNTITGRTLSMEIKNKTNKLICIYAPNAPADRKAFFDKINVEESSPLPIIMALKSFHFTQTNHSSPNYQFFLDTR